jgi:hypothetical protein
MTIRRGFSPADFFVRFLRATTRVALPQVAKLLAIPASRH